LSKLPAPTFPKAQVRADRVYLGTFQTSFQSMPMRLEVFGKVCWVPWEEVRKRNPDRCLTCSCWV